MRKEDCFQLGHISRQHGYKGEVIAVFETDRNEDYTNLESVLVEIRHELIPFFIETIAQNSKGHFILQFEDIYSSEDADELIGCGLYLPLSVLPPLSGKAFYFHEVIGFKMTDINKGEIGTCTAILDQTSQPVFVIENQGKEILIPAVDDFIESIDRQKKEIFLNTPEGLIDLYLDGE